MGKARGKTDMTTHLGKTNFQISKFQILKVGDQKGKKIIGGAGMDD
jgi:hypothetical protein